MIKITEIDILGIKFNNVSMKEAMSKIIEKYKKTGKFFIVTANPEIVMHAYRDSDYKNLINSSDLIVADGIGVVLGSRILHTPLKERVAGFDLTIELLKYADANNFKVFLLGAKQDVIERTASNIKQTYPNIQLVGYHDGYFDLDDKSILNLVGNSKPDIVLVATGFPKQEIWINKYHREYNQSIAIGVGGSFDVIAGVKDRAPQWIINWNLEWAYRLMKEPSRFKRMLDLPLFLFKVYVQKLN